MAVQLCWKNALRHLLWNHGAAFAGMTLRSGGIFKPFAEDGQVIYIDH
jgi:hypothetical protein